jgi:hypothetical protein
LKPANVREPNHKMPLGASTHTLSYRPASS